MPHGATSGWGRKQGQAEKWRGERRHPGAGGEDVGRQVRVKGTNFQLSDERLKISRTSR